MKILNIYNDFKTFEPAFLKWKEEQDLRDKKAQAVLGGKSFNEDAKYEQERAKIITNVLTSLDEYAQTKAEDIDSVSQTLLYIAVGALGTIGTFVGKNFSKFSKNEKIKKSLPSVMGIGFALGAFLPIVRTTVLNQVRANRIARFDGIHSDKLFNLNNFAVLNEEQKKEIEKQAKDISDKEIYSQNNLINRANIFNSMSVFREFTMKQGEFAYLKNQFDKNMSDDEKKLKDLEFGEKEKTQAKKDQKLFTDIMKKIDLESQYPLERIEKAVNVAYSSLFAGGVLEYLVSDGILDLLKVKNKVVRPVLAWGLPVLTIMSLNKQLANFLNDAVKAVRFKKMQEFVSNPDNFKEISEEEIKNASPTEKEEKKQGFFEFFKAVFKDIKDYENYQKTQRLEEKKQDLAARNIKLSQTQTEDAKLLRRNAELMINTLDDQLQKYASAMETITESTTIPLDIIAPVVGTFAADKLHRAFSPNGHFRLFYKGLGAFLAFLPAAMSEIYFVGRQRSAKRCAVLIANNNLQDSNKFLDSTEKENKVKKTKINWHFCAGEKLKSFEIKTVK